MPTSFFLFILLATAGCDTPTPEKSIPLTSTSPSPPAQGITKDPPATSTLEKPLSSPTPPPTTAVYTSPTAKDNRLVIKNAVANLVAAKSFVMDVRITRAYSIFSPDGETRLVFGDFHNHYQIIRSPGLKIHCLHEYRYDPAGSYSQFESYTLQQGDTFHTTVIEPDVTTTTETADINQVSPFSNDVYHTLIHYADQAAFQGENQGIAVYKITHPAWYQLQSALGFADLGFLSMQENRDERIKTYVNDHYPEVKPIIFTISIDTQNQRIIEATMDDRDFMTSVWEATHRALVNQGIKSEKLPRYQVPDTNNVIVFFEKYDEVPDFDIP